MDASLPAVAGVDCHGNSPEGFALRPTEPCEADFRAMVDAMEPLCWMADGDGWIFWFNSRWYEYTGTTPAEMMGWGWQSVHDSEALPAVVAKWRACLHAGEPFEMVFPLKGADGQFRPFLTRVMPAKGSDGRVSRWFGTNTDISSVQNSEKRLRRVLDNLFGFVGVLDLDGRLVEINTAPLAMADLRREDVIGHLLWDTHWWAWSSDVQSGLRAAFIRAKNGELVRHDVEVRARGDERIMIDFQRPASRSLDQSRR